MYQFILLIHVFVAVCIIALVLVQQGKGATLGPAYGGGASQTIFGSRGSGSFLFRISISFIVLFFMTSLGLNYITMHEFKNTHDLTLTPLQQIPSKANKAASQHEKAAKKPVTPSGIPARK
jgi:preprotein translocase subunit SecG